jgi:DNA-binding response OmpR family regulator
METFIDNISSQSEVMVVDDAPENIRLLTRILMEHNFNIIPVTSGIAALELIDIKQPDVVLLDVKMPGLSGFEVCKRIKANFDTKDLPIIFISGLDSIEDKIKGLEAGASDYITKPFNEKEVVLRVKNSLKMQIQLGEVKKEQLINNVNTHKKLINQSEEIKVQSEELLISNILIKEQVENQVKKSAELLIASKEKKKRADELKVANKELAYQNKEKAKRADELQIANFDLIRRKSLEQDLLIANKELVYQNDEKAKRADELQIANKELVYQNDEKAKRADELQTSERRYAQLSEQSRIFTWEINREGFFTFVDHVSETVTGYKPEELILKKRLFDLCLKCGKPSC